jgi:hypothetical protein
MEERDVELIERMIPELAGRDSLQNDEMFMAEDVADEQPLVRVRCDRCSSADEVDACRVVLGVYIIRSDERFTDVDSFVRDLRDEHQWPSHKLGTTNPYQREAS